MADPTSVMVMTCTETTGTLSISVAARSVNTMVGAVAVSATSMVSPAHAPESTSPCCHTRPQRRPFDPDGAMAQALRVPACAAGAAGNPRRPLVGAGAGQAARLDDALGAATMAEQNTVMVGEWHGNGLDIEHQRAPARSASSSRPAGAGVDHLHAGQGHRDPPGQRGRRDEGELVALLQALLTIELGKPHRSAHSPNGGLSTSWHHGAKPPILARRAACAAGTAGNPVLATCRCRSPSSRGRVSAPVRVVDLVHLPRPQPLKSVRASPP
jgi:hypothetical protein